MEIELERRPAALPRDSVRFVWRLVFVFSSFGEARVVEERIYPISAVIFTGNLMTVTAR